MDNVDGVPSMQAREGNWYVRRGTAGRTVMTKLQALYATMQKRLKMCPLWSVTREPKGAAGLYSP
jgi:hypothetical protein